PHRAAVRALEAHSAAWPPSPSGSTRCTGRVRARGHRPEPKTSREAGYSTTTTAYPGLEPKAPSDEQPPDKANAREEATSSGRSPTFTTLSALRRRANLCSTTTALRIADPVLRALDWQECAKRGPRVRGRTASPDHISKLRCSHEL